jgi:RNA polymerase sigma factor (sigma-70 family)
VTVIEDSRTDGTDAEFVLEDFAALFDRHAVAVHRYLARRVGHSAADDLLAQTFLVAFERRHSYDRARPDARPWLYGIASNLLRRHQRDEVTQYQVYQKTGVDPVLIESHAARVDSQVDAGAAAIQMAGALAALRAGERDVLLLYAWGDLSYAEVAAALDIPLGTVRSRLHRARTAIRAALPHLQGDS